MIMGSGLGDTGVELFSLFSLVVGKAFLPFLVFKRVFLVRVV
jgi:hypothetical protein